MPALNVDEAEKLYGDGYFYADQASSRNSEEGDIAPNSTTNHFIDVVPLRKVIFEERLSLIKKMFGANIRILDVGSGAGDFVMYGLSQGLNIQGVEFSKAAVKRAYEINKIQLLCGEINDVIDPCSFDLMHLNHVFEHFSFPVDELKKIRLKLGERGILYMEIPYQFHILEKIKAYLRSSPTAFTKHSVHHAYFYTPKTIKLLLNKCGFQVTNMKLYADSRYPSKTLNEKFKKFIWKILSYFGVGNYIEIIATKK